MKFLSRLRTSRAGATEPRLSKEGEPRYCLDARDAFLDVLMAASAVQCATGLERAERVDRLKAATERAARHCNGELRSRLHAYRDAVLHAPGGDVSKERERFISGCRTALDTNH